MMSLIYVDVSAPTNVRATVLTPYSVKVTWDQLSDVTGYLISYTNYASNDSITVNDGSTASYILTNLIQNTHYIITVQATTGGNKMNVKSNKVSITTYVDGKRYIYHAIKCHFMYVHKTLQFLVYHHRMLW